MNIEQDRVVTYLPKEDKWKLKSILAEKHTTITQWIRDQIYKLLKQHNSK